MENIPTIPTHPTHAAAWWLAESDLPTVEIALTPVIEVAIETIVDDRVHHQTDDAPSGFMCPQCRGRNLADDEHGLMCVDCESLSFVLDDDSLVRVDDTDLLDCDFVDPSEVPACSCGRFCDIESAAGDWHCSRCEPGMEERKVRTSVLLARVRILSQ